MNSTYYQYKGTISCSEGSGRQVVIGDILDYSKPPIALQIPCTKLAEYFRDRGWTDDEERYINQVWIYDRNLFLQAVVIPSTHDYIPAKVIACKNPEKMLDSITIFGPEELIDDPAPAPMDNEAYHDWIEFRNEFGLRPLN